MEQTAEYQAIAAEDPNFADMVRQWQSYDSGVALFHRNGDELQSGICLRERASLEAKIGDTLSRHGFSDLAAKAYLEASQSFKALGEPEKAQEYEQKAIDG